MTGNSPSDSDSLAAVSEMSRIDPSPSQPAASAAANSIHTFNSQPGKQPPGWLTIGSNCLAIRSTPATVVRHSSYLAQRLILLLSTITLTGIDPNPAPNAALLILNRRRHRPKRTRAGVDPSAAFLLLSYSIKVKSESGRLS